MISLLPNGAHTVPNRRDALRLAGLGTLGLTLPIFGPGLAGATATDHTATAKNCIYIFLCGGPSQLDMWDPKPEAPAEIRGPIQSIESNVPGIRLGEVLPKVAKHADKMAIIRSMTHDSNSHDIGILYTLLADSHPPTKLAYPPARSDHPGLGAILRALLGEQSQLPAWVTVPRPFTTGKRFYKGQAGGFLGPEYDPFFLDEEKTDSLADKPFRLPALGLADGMTNSRLAGRQILLGKSNAESSIESGATRQFEQYSDKA